MTEEYTGHKAGCCCDRCLAYRLGVEQGRAEALRSLAKRCEDDPWCQRGKDWGCPFWEKEGCAITKALARGETE